MRRRHTRGPSVLAFLLAICLTTSIHAQTTGVSKPVPSLTEIAEALQKREAKFGSVRIRWQQGDRANIVGDLAPKPRVKTKRNEGSAILSGDKWRLETATWSLVNSPAGVRVPLWRAFNGSQFQILHFGDDGQPLQGAIRKSLPYDDIAAGIDSLPLVLAFRPISSRLIAGRDEDWQVNDVWQKLDGRDCVLLECERHAGERPITVQAWLDPTLELAPVAYATTVNGRLSTKITIQYGDEPGFPPTGWTTTSYPGQRNPPTIVGRVAECAVDAQIADSEFSFTFPPGMHVFERAGEYDREMVVTPDGKLAPVN
jgi:hypothetical protein